MLHGPAIASDLQTDFNSFALPETVATSVLQLVSSAALGVSLWLLAGLLLRAAAPRWFTTRQFRYSSSPAVVPAPPYDVSLRARHRSAASSRFTPWQLSTC